MAPSEEVANAIAEIRATFSDATVDVTEDGQGGAFVVVDRVDPGPSYEQRETWVGFQITFQYPFSDCYPHFVRGDLRRKDGGGLGEGMTVGSWQGRSAIQVSRRSNKLDPRTDTAAIKLLKVLTWLGSR